MRPTRLEPLSAEAERLLATERTLFPESRERRERAMARARAALRETHAAPLIGFWRWRVPVLVLGTVAVALGAAATVGKNALLPPEELSNVASSASGSSDAREVVVPAPVPAEEAPRPEPERAAPPALGSPGDSSAPQRRTSNAPVSDSSAVELRLLQRARAAVARREFSTALEAILEHQRRFASGRLVEEREALRIKALAGVGRSDEAQRAAARFREHFPRSVLAPRVEETARPEP
jgi:hypothetical protein